jgi:hypothetical protein
MIGRLPAGRGMSGRREGHLTSQEEDMRNALSLMAVAVALALVLGGCGGTDDEPQQQITQWAYLHQQAPGDAPTIRLQLEQPSVPLEDQIFGWLFYRSADQRYFSLIAANLVDVIFESRLPGGIWDDSAPARGPIELSRDFTWIGPGGDQETGSIDVEFIDPALQPGVTYYHRVQRLVEPMSRAGSGAPIATLQVPTIDVDPWNALSQGSNPTAGVTYILPPVQQSPSDGAVNQSTVSITFSWSSTLGANEYVLQVFTATDPDGERNPRYQEIVRHDFGGTISRTITDSFSPGQRFYWRVGGRRSGEAQPVNGMLAQRGWLFSPMRTFVTAQAPPPPPGN